MTARDTRGVLRRIIDEAKTRTNLSRLDHLTVLGRKADPFRLDTPANHEAGQWAAEQIERIGRNQIHIRGIHYATLGERKPDGTKYANTKDDEEYLDTAVTAARWLGYVGFDRIVDQRNAAPVVRILERPEPVAAPVALPQIEETRVPEPRVLLEDLEGVQPPRSLRMADPWVRRNCLAGRAIRRAAPLGVSLRLPPRHERLHRRDGA